MSDSVFLENGKYDRDLLFVNFGIIVDNCTPLKRLLADYVCRNYAK